MPTYNYKCNSCGYIFEVFHSIKLEDHIICPKCKKEANKITIESIGFILKGSGFYKTDYGNKSILPKKDSKKP